MMETFAVKSAIKNVENHPEIISEMESLLQQFVNIADHDYSNAEKLESRFHSLFIMLTENDQLIKFYKMNWSVGAIFYMYIQANLPLSRQKKSFNDHSQLLKLLKEKNSEAICGLLQTHINSAKEILDWLIKNDTQGIFKK